jgi:hypothetical protein
MTTTEFSATPPVNPFARYAEFIHGLDLADDYDPVETDPDQVRDFIEIISKQAQRALDGAADPGVLQISHLHPASEKLVPHRYAIDDIAEIGNDAIAASVAGTNVYIEGRTVRRTLRGNTRGGAGDTVGVFALVIDSDADKNMAWNVSIEASLVIETSPGNSHHWFFLDKAIGATDAKMLGERIRASAQADHDSGTVTQPYRVAGTINYPGKAKRERGRTESMPTSIIKRTGRLWTVAEIEEAFLVKATNGSSGDGAANGAGAGASGHYPGESVIPVKLLKLIREGFKKGEKDRSGQFHKAVAGIKRLGGDVDDIVALFERYPKGIAAKYNGRLRKEVERCYSKIEIKQGIYVVDGQIARMVDEAEDGLIAKGVPILVRANALVQPIVTKLPTNRGRMTEATLLRALSTHNIIYLLNKNGIVFLRFNMKIGEWLEIDPPAKVALSLLVKGEWQFPRVAGVITVPTLRIDGTILDQPGYDPATQLWYAADSDFKMPAVSERPTREEALAALDLLEGLLKEFPFIGEVDRSVALAAMLTAILRGAFDVAPMFLIIAPSPGSGKSFLINLISNMVRGQDCPVITNCKSIEEMEKRLGALVLEGAPMINLDNCSEDIGGDLLCQVTEQRIIRIRILGKSEAPQCEWRGVMCATGNNVRLVGDMTRRGLICNIDTQLERPEQREFQFNPIEQILSNRGAYIAAALTIVRAYIAAGCPDNCGPLASYGPWSKNVRAPLIWLGKEDPVKSMEQARDLDPVRNAARALVAVWKAELQSGVSYSAVELIEEANEKKREATNMIDDKGERVHEYVFVRPGLRALLLEQAGTHRGEIDGIKLGKWLGSICKQIHSGHRIEITKESTRGNRYCLKRVA